MATRGRANPSPGRLDSRGREGRGDSLTSQNFLSGAAVSAALGGMAYSLNGRPLYPSHSGQVAGIPYMPSIFNSPKAGAAGGRMNSEPPTPTAAAAGAANSPTATTPTGRTPSHTAANKSFTTSAGSSPKSPGFAQPTFSSGLSYASRQRSSNLNATAPAGSLNNMARLINAEALASAAAASGSSLSRAPSSSLSASMPTTTMSRPSTGGSAALGTTSRPMTASNNGGVRPVAVVPGLALSSGTSQSMGCRAYQEDFRHILDPAAMPGLAGLPNILLGAAVYDGHGGKQVSQWLTTSYCLLNRCCEAVQALVSQGGSPNDIATTLDEVFVACGSAALATRMTAGSCASVVVLMHAAGVPWVLSANVGDSRTVLVSWDDDGSRLEAAPLSIDHKLGPPKASEETRRVQAAGGTVIQLFGTWRIDGSLAVARAIGDADFSRYVSSRPSVSCRQLSKRDRWLIIGSDGLYDVMTNDEVALFCKSQHQLSAAKLADALVREAVRNRGSGDNTTVIAVRIQYAPPN